MTYDFAVVGSGGGGGTISWLLAKAGFKVALLEQGPDLHRELEQAGEAAGEAYNAIVHDEYRFRLRNPRIHRRPRGTYNTRAEVVGQTATTFFRDLMGGWTGSTLGGGTVIWGTWGLRPFPLDFQLATFFEALKAEGQLGEMDAGYSVVDWPIAYREMVPFFNVAEALLAVSGSRDEVFESVRRSAWFNQLKGLAGFGAESDYHPAMEYPLPPYPRTPVGHLVYEGAERAGMYPCALPVSIVNPGSGPYQTRAKIAQALAQWGPGPRPGFWQKTAEDLWSDRVRTACNMCGFCGEYLCWGKDGPKSGTLVSTLRELKEDLPDATVICNARAYEVLYDAKTQRATGVAYLDVTNPDEPRREVLSAKHVIVSCGAVQTARLLLMSGPPGGLGNSSRQLGRNAMFHLFGLGMAAILKPKYQGLLHSEFGPTGNTATYANYLVKDDAGKWYKGGIFASTAAKNPLENAVLGATDKDSAKAVLGMKLLQRMDTYARRLELRITGDDLPRSDNRVDLDPIYVDEFGFPVARVTRSFGQHEGADQTQGMQKIVLEQMKKLFASHVQQGVIDELQPGGALLDLIGDHQMGTCRMGEDPKKSVLDPYCRMHDVQNVFVVDTSFMPTGFGVNPMVTVVANALRVGTWIVEQSKRGKELA